MDPIALTKIIAPELELRPAAPGAAAGADGGFADLLREGMDRLEALEHDSKEQVRQMMAGEDVELHRVILAGEQAGLAFELMMSVRNKVVDAYQEVMRMQV